MSEREAPPRGDVRPLRPDRTAAASPPPPSPRRAARRGGVAGPIFISSVAHALLLVALLSVSVGAPNPTLRAYDPDAIYAVEIVDGLDAGAAGGSEAPPPAPEAAEPTAPAPSAEAAAPPIDTPEIEAPAPATPPEADAGAEAPAEATAAAPEIEETDEIAAALSREIKEVERRERAREPARQAPTRAADDPFRTALADIEGQLALRPAAPLVGSEGGGGVENLRYRVYYDLLWKKIKREWTLPRNFEVGGLMGETVVALRVHRDGSLQEKWIEKSSGNGILDEAAMRAVIKAAPFPPVPFGLGGNTLEIGIRFHTADLGGVRN